MTRWRDSSAGMKRLFRHRDWPLLMADKMGARLNRYWTERLNFTGAYEMKDRRKHSESLLVVVAGYKEYLWELTLPRIARFIPPEFDVCIVSPGVRSPVLLEIADKNGWSYLTTRVNKLALAQNVAIREHPKAAWIYKLDEDIFVSEGYFERLLEGYLQIRLSGAHDPGFCSPLLNLNGFSYRTLLNILNIEGQYRTTFGELKSACMGVKAHCDAEAARWLWEKSLPFDEVARFFASRPFEYSVVPHRFSIGAILLEREFWETIGGFRTSLYEGAMGIEEEDLCFKCMASSRVMCVVHDVFAGHFAFGLQEAGMKGFLDVVREGTSLGDRQPRVMTTV